MPSYNKVVLSGTLASGAEAWSTSCSFAQANGNNISDPTALTVWADEIEAGIGSLLGSALTAGLSSTGAVREVKVYYYPDTDAPAQAVGAATLNTTGLGTSDVPLSTAAVASLQTGLAGRRYRGRMYWPALAWSVSATGLFSGTDPAVAAAQIAELLEGIATRSPGVDDPVPVVVSKVGGFVTPVTAVSVDTVPDTQRSRQKQLSGTRVTSLYPAP